MTILVMSILLYGVMLFGQPFPVQERVEAGVSYQEMLAEMGWGGAYIVSFLLIMGFSQMLTVFEHAAMRSPVTTLLLALVPAVCSDLDPFVRPTGVRVSVARDVLARHDGTWHGQLDSGHHWLGVEKPDERHVVLHLYLDDHVRVCDSSPDQLCTGFHHWGCWQRVPRSPRSGYTGWQRRHKVVMLFAAATLYAVGKTFFWPTTLGIVSEQYPRGGATAQHDVRRGHDCDRHDRRPGHWHAARY